MQVRYWAVYDAASIGYREIAICRTTTETRVTREAELPCPFRRGTLAYL